jgi:hypothetical protein
MVTKFLIVTFAMQFAWLGVVNAASVKATVDTVEVVHGNPVTLHIKASGGGAAFPEVKMIDDAHVLSTSTSSSRNLTMINGTVSSEVSTTKTLQFIPRHDTTIPAYTVNISGKKYKTKPIFIKVVKASSPSSQVNALFDLKMTASKNKVQVGESFVVTVYFSLRNNVQLNQEVQYTQPGLSAFVAQQLEDKVAYRKSNYQVQEIRYIVTAQKEGTFSIDPASAKIGLADSRKRDIFGMSFGTKWYQKASNTLMVEVIAPLQECDLLGDFTVDTKVDKQEVKANKPVNVTVNIEGKGNLNHFDFTAYEIDGVTVYSDDAKVDTKIVNGEIYSTYSKKFVFISSDDFTIPERHFSMYSPKDKSLKSLTVKHFDIKVKTNKAMTSHVTTAKGIVQTNNPQTIPSKDIIVEKKVEVQTVAWWMLALAFVLGAGVMYMLRYMPKAKEKPYKEENALKILYAHISEDAEIEEMVRKLYAKKSGDKSVEIDKKKLREMVERFR